MFLYSLMKVGSVEISGTDLEVNVFSIRLIDNLTIFMCTLFIKDLLFLNTFDNSIFLSHSCKDFLYSFF